MKHLSSRERELVAVGAAVASNCVPCIEYHIPEARKAGLGDSQIAEAVRLADEVRQVPARRVLQSAHALLPSGAEAEPEAARGLRADPGAPRDSGGDAGCCS